MPGNLLVVLECSVQDGSKNSRHLQNGCSTLGSVCWDCCTLSWTGTQCDQTVTSLLRWWLCHSAEEHRGSACGDGTHVLRRDGSSTWVLAQLWHRAPGPQTWQVCFLPSVTGTVHPLFHRCLNKRKCLTRLFCFYSQPPDNLDGPHQADWLWSV